MVIFAVVARTVPIKVIALIESDYQTINNHLIK